MSTSKKKNKNGKRLSGNPAKAAADICNAAIQAQSKFQNPVHSVFRAHNEDGGCGVGVATSEAMPCSCGCGQFWPSAWADELEILIKQLVANGDGHRLDLIDEQVGYIPAGEEPMLPNGGVLFPEAGLALPEERFPIFVSAARWWNKSKMDDFADLALDALAYAWNVMVKSKVA